MLLLGAGGSGAAVSGGGLGQQAHGGRVERWLSAEGEGDEGGAAASIDVHAPLFAPVHVHLPPPDASPSALAVSIESSCATPTAGLSDASDGARSEETAGQTQTAADQTVGGGVSEEPPAPAAVVTSAAPVDQSVDREHLLTQVSADDPNWSGGPQGLEAEATADVDGDHAAVHVPDDQETPLLPNAAINAPAKA